MNYRQKSNIQYFIDICVNEHHIADVNIAKYEQAVSRIQNLIEEPDETLNYEDTIKDLSNVFDILRKFNLEVAKYRLRFFHTESEYDGLLNGSAQRSAQYRQEEEDGDENNEEATQQQQPSIRNTNSLGILQKTLQKSMVKHEHKQQNHCNDEQSNGLIPIKSFNYPTNDFSKYLSTINYDGKCIISYVENIDTKIFYLIEATSADNTLLDLNNLQTLCKDSNLIDLPDPNVVFGLFTDNYLFRAVRENFNEQIHQDNEDKIKVFLLDVGEILEIFYNDPTVSFYALPEHYANLPAQAFKAKLVSVNGGISENIILATYLNENKYSTVQKFKIIEINNFILYVELILNSSVENNNNSNEMEKLGACCAEITNEQSNKAGRNTITQEQIDILNEEPLNTTNAMVAVIGYDPQDEKRICKFYNKDINGCFKGSNCRMEHVEILKDGWTRDKIPSKISSRAPEIRPQIGKTLTIVPTYVVNVGVFYGHILNLTNSAMKLLPTLSEILRKMNMIEIKSQYKKLTKLPYELELVLSLFTDNQWYRSRVLRVMDDRHVKVFYVDYGNCHIVTLDKLREWDQRFDYYPFQAYIFRIDNCVKLNDYNIEAIGRFRKLILNRHFLAKVTCNVQELYVTMMDKNGFDVGEKICGMGDAIPKEITTINISNQIVPL